MRIATLLAVLMALPALAQDSDPRPVTRQEPTYSKEAQKAQLSGEVLVILTVDALGQPRNVQVVRPLGLGLDEKALESVEGWTFKPAIKSGQPVESHVAIEIGFHLVGGKSREEKDREKLDPVLKDLENSAKRAKAIEKLKDLAKHEHGPAMFLYSLMLRDGKDLPADKNEADRLLVTAAKAQYGLAEYELGRQYLTGERGPSEVEKGRELVIQGAKHGSNLAQAFVGKAYSQGLAGLMKDNDAAREYFTMCAARGNIDCRLQLGALLLQEPQIYPEVAITWLELAVEQGSTEAQRLLQNRTLTDPQRKLADSLKNILRKPR